VGAARTVASVYSDRVLIEERIARELAERVRPLVEHARRPLTITAGPSLDEQRPFAVGDMWGAPWATTWFVFTGEIPVEWGGRRVEATLDLGFTRDAPGFQCEGLVFDAHGRPLQGIHPRRTNLAVEAIPGACSIRLEAASNPSFPNFVPSQLGSLSTAGDRPLYRFRQADLVLVDNDAESLVHDLDVLDGLMRTMALDDPRRARLLRVLARSLDRVPDIAAARLELAAALKQSAAPATHRVIAIGHAHIDTAWLWPISETARKCTRTFSSAVSLMDEHPGYRFACSQAQQYAWIEEQHPDLFERIKVKVAGGQWIPVGGMWVEADMNLPSGESLARQIIHGQRYFESRFGRRCSEVWIPDVFGYPASMPQVYAAGGMRRFVTQKLSWNNTNRFPHHTFWWEGLDGTRVLTHFPPVDTYNAEITPAECVASVERFRDGAWSDWSLMPFGYGDGGGGPTPEMLARIERLADLDGSPRISIDSPAAFFERVEREHFDGAPVPVWRGELYFETHRGTLTSQLRTKLGNRRCERLLRDVELWAATARRHIDLDELWHKVLTQQFHDIIPGSSIAWVHADAERIHGEVTGELEAILSGLFDVVVPAGPHVVNSSALARDEVIEVDGIAHHVSVGGHAIVPLVPVSENPGPITNPVVVGEHSMANHRLAVRWDNDGNIISIIAIDAAREIVPTGSTAATLEVAPDHPVRYDAWDLESWTPGLAAEITAAESVEVVDSGPLIGRLRVTRTFGPSTAVITYTLRAGSPRLDIGIQLDWRHDEHLLSMSFPLDVRADTAACDIQFGHVRRPTHPSTSWDAAKFEVCAHRYVDVSEPTFGVAILNDGRYGHGLFDGRVRVSLARAACYPDPDADRGRHSVNLALFPHGPGLSEVVAEAERFNSPLRVTTGGATTAPPPVVRLTGSGVEVDAVKLADDGSGDLIVRLHEAVGDRTPVTLACDRRIVAASLCNLLEEPHTGIDVGDGICAITLHPFQLATTRLTRS
jgi:alpha-mannosidase